MWYKNRIELPGEIIYEVIAGEDNQGFGLAVADIKKSKPHYHLITVEAYTLISGHLIVYVDGCPFLLERPGAGIKIPLGVVHWTENLDPTTYARISVITVPPWTPEDHILA